MTFRLSDSAAIQNGGRNPLVQYAYDPVGNRLARRWTTAVSAVRSESYTYDAIDQIIGADYHTNAVIERYVSYGYDPAGNRTNVVDNGTPTSYTPNNLNQYTPVGGGERDCA